MEGDLCERFHWTFTELDSQAEERVIPAVFLMNIRDSLRRINAFLESHGRIKPSDRDFELYDYARKLAEAEK